MDLGDVDLDDMDLGDSAEVDDDDDSEFNISELSEDVDEVSTKLDLARAYIDMGDKDGARSILEEVKSEGNNEQQQQAEELIQQAG
jgi:pilus assembly protein FimV